jgi:hypothetical protein
METLATRVALFRSRRDVQTIERKLSLIRKELTRAGEQGDARGRTLLGRDGLWVLWQTARKLRPHRRRCSRGRGFWLITAQRRSTDRSS